MCFFLERATDSLHELKHTFSTPFPGPSSLKPPLSTSPRYHLSPPSDHGSLRQTRKDHNSAVQRLKGMLLQQPQQIHTTPPQPQQHMIKPNMYSPATGPRLDFVNATCNLSSLLFALFWERWTIFLDNWNLKCVNYSIKPVFQIYFGQFWQTILWRSLEKYVKKVNCY